jgi:type I restriction enzyme S subunit
MGKYQAYMEYKDFESVFLTEIPASWEVKPLHTLCDFRQGKAHEPFVDGDGQFICVNARFVSTQGHSAKRCTENLTPAYLHDVLMVMSDLPNGRALARAFYVEEKKDYAVNQRICAITAKKICAKFLFYQLDRSPYFLMYDDGSNQTHLSNDTYKKYPVLLPSVSEQQIIANFLDHETAKIDILIEKQQQLIVLLKEKRQTVISHAVTKGLNANAPMRDSGVEWLGEVPEHWIVKNYRYATQIYRGKFGHRPRNDPAFYDGEYPFIQTGDVAQAGKTITKYKQTLNERGISVSQKFPAGTLVMAIAANIGDTAILDFEAYAPDSVVGFKPNIDVELEFLRYSLMAALPALEQTSTQSTQANLNIDRIGTVKASFPPLSEQLEIVAKLDSLHEQYADIEIKAIKAIKLMQERRTALISAAVTGKIDVRDFNPKDAEIC